MQGATKELHEEDFLMRNDYVLPFKYSGWLVVSSLIILIPVHMHAWNGDYDRVLVYGGSALASINYWCKATPGNRRNVDVVLARFAVVYSVLYEVSTASNFAVACLAATPVCYASSFYLHSRKSPTWLAAHFCMHLFMAFGILGIVRDESSSAEVMPGGLSHGRN